MKRLIFLTVLFLAGNAWGATDQLKFLFGTTVAGTTVAADTTGSAVCFQSHNRKFVLQLNGDFVSGTSTLDVLVQHGFNDGIWKTLDTFTQVTTTDSTQRIHINNDITNVMQCLRAVIDVGAAGSPNYKVSVAVLYENEK